MDSHFQNPSSESKYFSDAFLLRAQILLQRLAVSFFKETQNYYVISAIFRDQKTFEAKLKFQKGDSNTDPFKTQCDCPEWTKKNHCSHVAALYLYKKLQESREAHIEDSLHLNFAVYPKNYGTYISSPSEFLGAEFHTHNYSMLQFRLSSGKAISFPSITPFKGKIVLNFRTYLQDYMSSLKFSYSDNEGHVTSEISIFEGIYLFNWKTGECFSLNSSQKNTLLKLKIYALSRNDETLNLSDIFSLCGLKINDPNFDILIDEKNLDHLQKEESRCRVIISSEEVHKFFNIELLFHNESDDVIPFIPLFKTLAFSSGKLSSFKSKKAALKFLSSLVTTFKTNKILFSTSLLNVKFKSFWSHLVETILDNEALLIHSSKRNSLSIIKTDFIKALITALSDHFTIDIFKYSNLNLERQSLNFKIPVRLLLLGLVKFQKTVSNYNVSIYYNREELSVWNSRVRFERNFTQSKWFDLKITLDDFDLETIQNANLDQGLSLTKKGLILLSNEQKDQILFLKKYLKYDSTSQESEFDPETKKEKKKFILPFKKARLFELLELKKLGLDHLLTKEEENLAESLLNLKNLPTFEILDKDLDKTMWPYQKRGLFWLKFLYDHKLGACLADDMGLGKTLQAIAFLKTIYEKVSKILIVCPVTILLNWQKEFEKFSDLKVHIYHGGIREIPSDIKIILTSYGVLKKEADTKFKDYKFDVFILDEVQYLKNMRSLGALSARKIHADFRICLTGTPVENDLAEFYNILDLSIPGIWGDLQFIRTVSNPETRKLAKITARPFILRRTKAEVLKDLPQKQEDQVLLNFTDPEQAHYNDLMQSLKRRIHLKSGKKKYGEILKGLLYLRQACLWQKTPDLLSTKIDFLCSTLSQIIAENHQAIIFSQFTKYLDIIEKKLRKTYKNISRIDGQLSIKKRQKEIDEFQSGKNPIFLISLKAAGIGLNLTAASYVFIMDPWWNPAVENQAIDRAHRIGQKNKLTVYRPIIKNSVEEKVLILQEAKKQLFSDLLSSESDEFFTGRLSMKDFENFF